MNNEDIAALKSIISENGEQESELYEGNMRKELHKHYGRNK